MGYTTRFEGQFNLDKPLSIAQQQYLTLFSKSRRVKRNASKLKPDRILCEVGLSVGKEGCYFVGEDYSSIVDENYPPADQPELYCAWIPNEDGESIGWDGSEKFYKYIEWMQYLINNFLKPWGYVVNGTVIYQGEDAKDSGEIVIKNNVLERNQSFTFILTSHERKVLEKALRCLDSHINDYPTVTAISVRVLFDKLFNKAI